MFINQPDGTKMISIAGIRFFIEFSSILVLAFLCIMHEFTDVTWAKQFNFDHVSTNQQHHHHQVSTFDGIEQASSLPSHQDDGSNRNKPSVRFSPESLNFGHYSIGLPVIKTVHVYNEDDEINLQMISISGNTEHFHCSFFEEKILPPRSNTSFQVVFLARQEGLVNNTLYIHSSAGSFHYRVSAFGEVSPFRVRPLIGARVPLNSSFASLIYIYNPFSTPLQLTEMYTSGGGLHLELPDDEYEAPSTMWNVPPYETRPVMKAHFVARIASNHTSYIRIRTNQPEIQLMLPVEVEVSNSPGLYSPLDTLDFGVLRAKHDPPKTLPIQVINAAQKSVSVQSIVVTPISDGLTIVDFSGPIKLPPQSSNPFHVGKLVLDPSQFSCSGLCLGKVLIKSKNNQYKLTIPFIVRVIQGELYFNSSQSHFFMNHTSNYSEQRVLSVENRFDSAIIVHDIILPDEAKPYFRLTTKHPYSLPVTLPVGEKFSLIQIEFTPSPQLSHFSTVFRLLTNLSYFDLPLYAYQGRLDLFIPNSSDQSKLDMGLVGLNKHKSSTFVVANHNPIAIRLIYWHCNISGVNVELVGTSQGNISAISHRIETSMETSSSVSSSSSSSELRLLEPNHFGVFRVHINKLSKEGFHNGIISIMTAYEKLTVPMMIKVLSGSLTADQVIMPKSFPGKIVKSSLSIKSNYSSNIRIKGAFIEPKDDRFKIKLIDQLIKPGQDNQIQIIFDPSAACFQKLCYTALDVEKEVGHLWLLGSGLYSDTAYIDKELYKLLRNQWLMMTELDHNPAIKVRLQIDGFGSFMVPVQAHQHWPRLANKLIISFPSIRVGQKVSKELLIENTADRQVLVQAINVIDYPNSEILLQLISNTIFHQQWSKSDLQAIQSSIRNGHNRSAFSLQNNTIASNSQVQRITEWLGVEPNANSYIMLLPPGVRHRLAVTFNPPDERNYTSLLILRNNLTIIDVVMLRGEGGRGLLKIGKTLPNTSNSRLVFDFPERTLERRCRNLVIAKSGTSSTTMTSTSKSVNYNTLVMKERFKAVNIGRMELQIRNFLIDGMPCEGHGFRISRCEPIKLLPNQTFDIEILYSPDFTQHSITHELMIMIDDDSFSAQRFLLVANIPTHLLTLCLDALPRPVWEPHLYYILVMMALFVLILSIIVAMFDGHRIALNYYNSKYEFLCNSKKHDDDEDDSSGINGENHNTCKCDHNHESTNMESGKKIANGSATNGSTIMNGKHYQTVPTLANQQKVRNRRNANKQNNNTTNHQHHQMNGNVQRRQTQMKTIPTPSKSHSEITKTNNSLNFDTDLYSNSWRHITQSSEFVRQDSSSSEHSNRSLDYSSKIKTNNDDVKKSSNDSLNETSNNNSSNNSPNANRVTKKTKRESSTQKQLETIKTETITPRNSVKKQAVVKPSTTKSQTKTDNKKEKSTKCNLNNSAVTSESLKSSLESLTCTKDESTGGNENFIQKTRSATLPITLNESNQIKNVVENLNVSESNISCKESNRVHNQVLENSIKETSSLKLDQQHPKSLKEQKNESFRTKSDFSNKSTNYFGYFESNKDIWDSITNFDTEVAMNQFVKQTEEFAATDEKISSRTYFNSSHYQNQNNNNRRNDRNLNSTRFNNVNDDKWEIGEWSNDFLLERASINNEELSKPYFNNNNNNSFNNYESTAINNFKRHNFPSSNTVNYQEYRNSLNDNNNSSRFLKSTKKMYTINDRQTSSPPSFTSQAHITNNNINNSSLSSTFNAVSSNSGTSTTFSPIIGRPQQSNQAPIQRNQLMVDPQQNQNKQHSFDNFEDNFIALNSLGKSLNQKSLNLQSPFNNHTNANNKTYFGNLNSFLDSSKTPTYNHKSNNNSLSLSGSNVGNNDNITLGSLLRSENWNSISEFNALDPFVSNNHSVSNKPISGMFNLSDNLWTPTTTWPASNNSTTSNIFSQFPSSPVPNNQPNTFCNSLSNDHSMRMNSSNKWPISPSSSMNNSSGNLRNSDYHPGVNRNDGTDGIWSAFDSFNYGLNYGHSDEFNNINGNNVNLKSTVNCPLESSGLCTEASNAAFDGPSFELFKLGKSLWSPLGSSPESIGTNGGTNFLSPGDSLFGRFSHNSSPASSSSGGGSSASGNHEPK